LTKVLDRVNITQTNKRGGEIVDKNKILETCSNDMLKTLYEHRENEEGIITSEFVEELKQTQTERNKKYKEFEAELKNSIKDEEKSFEIIELLNQYEDVYNNEHGLYYKQYYKTGAKDMIKLILECLS